MIRVPAADPAPFGMTRHGLERLREHVHTRLEKGEKLGLSLSGASASIAIEWFEAHRIPYQLTSHPGLGYTVDKRMEGSDL